MYQHQNDPVLNLVPRAASAVIDHGQILSPIRAPSIVKRSPADSTDSDSSNKTCGPDDDSAGCERPVSSSSRTIPIVLGAVIPVTIAIIIFFYLHRRHVKKLRNEDANDKHKSLDFGMDFVSPGNKGGTKGANGSQMTDPGESEKQLQQHRPGLSMDWTMDSPYLLPPGLNGSQESLHSMSRALHGADDKYRPANTFTPGDNGSMRSSNRRDMDDASSFTASSSRHVQGDEMQHNLLRNAQRMPKSPASMQSTQNQESTAPSTVNGFPAATHNEFETPTAALSRNDSAKLEDSHNHLGALIERRAETPSGTPQRQFSPMPPEDSGPALQLPAVTSSTSFSSAPAVTLNADTENTPKIHVQNSPQQIRSSRNFEDDQSDYGDGKFSNPPLPQVNVQHAEDDHTAQNGDTDPVHDLYDQYYDADYHLDTRRLTMGIRPLPPEDPSDNPEQRANRIRSFYKEYFDESKPPQQDYYEDYGPEVYGNEQDDSHMYPGDYFPGPPPFTQPMGRRAMTPPPRMPGDFAPPPRHQLTSSAAGFAAGSAHGGFPSLSSIPGPRAFSSASGRFPGRAPKKPMPPPSPLHVLPTPHKLKDDTFLPIDFAPGTNSNDRRVGRPETPQGGLRPYMLAVPAHVPLASSYDDLAAIPSPHSLRRSGTFTALDFAPPPRFKNSDSGTASDSGSIRSNNTGISAAQAHSIRSGAYRTSRLPPETVGTRDDFTSNLRPTWGMGR